MSENSRETFEDDLTSYSLDDEDQLQPEDTLLDDDLDDVLDRGYSPADTDRGSRSWGTTPHEQALGETIEQRIAQEEPDPNSAYGAPLDESGLAADDELGHDDPDSDDELDGWYGDHEVGDARAGRLVASDEGAHEDDDKDSWARDVGVDGAGASAEEAAMHVFDPDALPDGDDY